MSRAEALAENRTLSGEAENDNRPLLEIAPGLCAAIPRERLERAARLLARRFVDLAIAELEKSTCGND